MVMISVMKFRKYPLMSILQRSLELQILVILLLILMKLKKLLFQEKRFGMTIITKMVRDLILSQLSY